MHLSNFNSYNIHLSAVAKPLKQHFPAAWLLSGKHQPQSFQPLGKQEKKHGNTGLLPRLMYPSVPLSRVCVLDVFCVSIHPQPWLPPRFLWLSFLRDVFSIVIHARPKAECIKATAGWEGGGGGRQYLPLLELILQIASESLPSHSSGALSVDVPGGAGAGEALVSPSCSLQGALPLERLGWGGCGRMLTRRVPRDVGKARLCDGLAPLGRAVGKPVPGRSCSRGSRIPRSPVSPLQ